MSETQAQLSEDVVERLARIREFVDLRKRIVSPDAANEQHLIADLEALIAALEAIPYAEMVEALREIREELATVADKQADSRGDYLYRGEPDSWLVKAIGKLDTLLTKIGGSHP